LGIVTIFFDKLSGGRRGGGRKEFNWFVHTGYSCIRPASGCPTAL